MYFNSQRFVIFLIHEVTDHPSKFQSDYNLYLSTQEYRQILKLIKETFFVVSLPDLKKFTVDGRLEFEKSDLPRCLITFDDAWMGQKQAIQTATNDFGLPVTLFTNVGTILSGVDTSALLTYFPQVITLPLTFESIEALVESALKDRAYKKWQGSIFTWEDLIDLSSDPLVTIANHGYYHLRANHISIETFQRNVIENETELLNLRGFERVFAHPHGRPLIDFGPEHDSILGSQGYSFTFSTQLNYCNLTDVKSLPRITLTKVFAEAARMRFMFHSFVQGQIVVSRYRNHSSKTT